MRIKNLAAHSKQSFSVNYLYDKEQRSNQEGNDNVIPLYKNFDNNNTNEWISITKKNCDKRFKNNKSNKLTLDWNKNTMQLIISLNPEDNKKMENAWEEVLDKVIKELEIDPIRNNVAAWLHKDKKHHHVHLLFSKINDKGDKWNDSHIGRRINSLALEMVKDYDLNYQEKNKGNHNRTVEPVKKEVNRILFYAVKEAKSYEDFLTVINSQGVKAVYDDKNSTLCYNYKVGDKEYSFNQSSLQNRFEYENVVRISDKKEFIHNYTEQKEFIKRAVSRVLNTKITTYNELEEKLLKDFNIKVIFNKSKTDKVTGVSFISNQEKSPFKIKGSQIDFSKSRIEYYMKRNITSEAVSIADDSIKEKKQFDRQSPTPYFGASLGGGKASKTNVTQEDVESDEERRLQKRKAEDKGKNI